MSVQFSVAVRNAELEAIETATGTGPILKLVTGAKVADCATADVGTVLVSMTLPSDWMSAAASGVKALLGAWSGAGLAAGTIGHFRIYDSAGTTCHHQGSVTATGGGGDMTVDNAVVAVSQVVNVTGYTLTAGNA